MSRLALRVTVLFVLVGLLGPLSLVSGNVVAFNSLSTTILITAVYYDTYGANGIDEAFRLMNVSAASVDLTYWTVSDGPSEGTVTLQDTLPTWNGD